MASSGGVTRGSLRPGFSRSPPFLLIGLIITAGISAFNYWNLSAQYSDLVKEITELQEHIQIVTLKRETAEKHVDALQQRLSESGDQLGRLKVEIDKRKQQERKKDEELQRLHTELGRASELLRKQNESLNELQNLKKELASYKVENEIFVKKTSVLHKTVADLKLQIAGMSQQLVSTQFQVPPIRQVHDSKHDETRTSQTLELQMDLNKGAEIVSDGDDRLNVGEENETINIQDGAPVRRELLPNAKENLANGSKNETVSEKYENDMWGRNLAKEIPIDEPANNAEADNNAILDANNIPSAISIGKDYYIANKNSSGTFVSESFQKKVAGQKL